MPSIILGYCWGIVPSLPDIASPIISSLQAEINLFYTTLSNIRTYSYPKENFKNFTIIGTINALAEGNRNQYILVISGKQVNGSNAFLKEILL